MDILMIVFICLISLLLIGMNIYLLVYYSSPPDDKGWASAIISRIIIVKYILKIM